MRTLGIGDISTRDTSGKGHGMKMVMEAMPRGKIARSVEYYPVDTDIYGAGIEERI